MKSLLNKLKHPEKSDMIWFFFNGKNFDYSKKADKKNERTQPIYPWECTPSPRRLWWHWLRASIESLSYLPYDFFWHDLRVNAIVCKVYRLSSICKIGATLSSYNVIFHFLNVTFFYESPDFVIICELPCILEKTFSGCLF